ncbi:MAG: hypothetical protein LBH93_00320 [Chitinispirillales bacterium]|nr:hypothetical protein [Chitinispirillales bacterium]
MINDLYANEWSLYYQNYFCPSMKLAYKTKINSKYKKTTTNQKPRTKGSSPREKQLQTSKDYSIKP